MNAEPLTFWNSGIWLIPLVLAATIAGLYFLVRYLRSRTLASLKEIRAELRRITSQRRAISGQVVEHSVQDEEPYRTPMTAIQEHLQEIDDQIHEFHDQSIAIQEEVRILTMNRGLAMIGAPYFWVNLHRRTRDLLERLGSLSPFLMAVDQEGHQVRLVAWQVAVMARKCQDDLIRLNRLLGYLSAHQIQGAALESALRQEEGIRQSIETIPDLFFIGVQETVIAEAQKDSVVEGFQIVEKIRPVLETLLTQAREWEKQYRAIVEQMNGLRQQLEKTAATLQDPPPSLNLESQKRALEGLQVIYRNLRDTLTRLEVESLPVVIAESQRVRTAGLEMETQIRQARQSLAALEVELPDLAQNLKRLTQQFASLSAASVRPVNWGKSRVLLTTLSRQVNEMNPNRGSRQPEHMIQDLDTTRKIKGQLQELTSHYQVVSTQHTELAGLISDPDLAAWREWEKISRDLIKKCAVYAPENWLRQDNILMLPSDLASIADWLDKMAVDDRIRPVEEAEIAETVSEVRQLQQSYRNLRLRTVNINSRLVEIQSAEKDGFEKLEHSRVLFQQFSHLIRSNPFLTRVAVDEAGKILKELEVLIEELRHPEKNTVEKKYRHITDSLGKAGFVANGWLEKLTIDMDAQNKQLSTTIAALDAVAVIDEPAIAQARDLLNTGPAFTSRASNSRSLLNLDSLLPELKRRCDYWQRVSACRHSLDDFSRQVLDNYQAANQNRRYARDGFQKVTVIIHSSQDWAPTSISLQAESQELNQLDGQWEGLRSQRLHGVALAGQLGGLSARYRALGDRALQAAERAEEDRNQVRELVDDYTDLVQLWQDQARAYSANPQTSQDIQNLLVRSDRELNSIRQSSRQGTLSYVQVLQALRILIRNLRIGLVTVDETHTLDIHGRVTTKRS